MIEAVPAESPFTMPVVRPMVATPVLPDVQLPPVEVVASVIEDPAQVIKVVPVMGAGTGFTVTVCVTKQPVAVSM